MPSNPNAGHPGNDYYVNSVTHTIQRQSNPLLAASLKATGWLGPFDWAHAKAAASGLASVTPNPVTGMPTGPGITANPAQALQNLGGIGAIGDFFNRLTQPNTWLRVGEVVAGLILAYIGLNALMRDTAAGKAVNSAKRGAMKVAEVVPK